MTILFNTRFKINACLELVIGCCVSPVHVLEVLEVVRRMTVPDLRPQLLQFLVEALL